MKPKHYFVLLLASLLPAFFLFQRTSIIGADSYYFFNYICSITHTLNAPYFSQLFMQFTTCNITQIFFINWLAIFFCSTIIAHLGEHFYPKNGWLAGLFAYTTPYFILELVKFEDDLLAFPILVLAQYFWFSGHKKTGFGLTALALLFWNGAIIYVLPFSTIIPMAFLVACLCSVLVYGSTLASYFSLFWSANGAMENYPVVGVIMLGPLLIGWITAFKDFLEQRLPFWKELACFLVLAFLNAKFLFHAIPLLSVMMVGYWEKLRPRQQKVLLAFSMLLLLGTSAGIQKQPPSNEIWTAIDYVSDLNEPVLNSFGLGYWMEFKGLEPSAKGAWIPQDFNGSLVLSMTPIDCEMVKDFNRLALWHC